MNTTKSNLKICNTFNNVSNKTSTFINICGKKTISFFINFVCCCVFLNKNKDVLKKVKDIDIFDSNNKLENNENVIQLKITEPNLNSEIKKVSADNVTVIKITSVEGKTKSFKENLEHSEENNEEHSEENNEEHSEENNEEHSKENNEEHSEKVSDINDEWIILKTRVKNNHP